MAVSYVFVKNCRLPIAKAELSIAEDPATEVKNNAGSSVWHYYQGNQLVLGIIQQIIQAPSTLEGTEIPFTEIDTYCAYGFAFPIPVHFTIWWPWPLECLINNIISNTASN